MKNIKKILALALVFVSVLAISVPAFAAVTKWVNITPNLNFRVSPGGVLIDRIPYGVAVTEYSTSYVNGVQWSYIYYNGNYGYVQTQYLSSSNPGLQHPQTQAFGSSLLQQGSTGYTVKNLQLALNHGGFPCGTADGIFGSRTHDAVVAYQDQRGLTADGLVGPATREQLWLDFGPWLMSNGVMN